MIKYIGMLKRGYILLGGGWGWGSSIIIDSITLICVL